MSSVMHRSFAFVAKGARQSQCSRTNHTSLPSPWQTALPISFVCLQPVRSCDPISECQVTRDAQIIECRPPLHGHT